MKISPFPVLVAGLIGVVMLLAAPVVARPAALPAEITTEPSATRPRPTPAPTLQLDPIWGVAGMATEVRATGALWTPGVGVTLYWDGASLGSTPALANGSFQMTFFTPTSPPPGSVGFHTVTARQGSLEAQALFELRQATPTPTRTVTQTPTATGTRTPTATRTPLTPSPTASPSLTPTGTPTLRPITPIVTGTSSPAPTGYPPSTATNTLAPVASATARPSATTPAPTPTPSPTATSSATASPTATDTASPTASPTGTSTPTFTPGAGTPIALVLPTPTVTITPEPSEAMPTTGGGLAADFVTGFVAGILVLLLLIVLVTLILITLLVAWRILRTRQVREKS